MNYYSDKKDNIKNFEKFPHEIKKTYKDLTGLINDGIVIIQDKLIRYTNQRFKEITGYNEQELLNRSFFNLVHINDLPVMNDYYKNYSQSQVASPWYEIAIKHRKGHKIKVEIRGKRISVDNMSIFLLTVHDIRERKQCETYRKREERYKDLWDNAPIAYMNLDKKGIITQVNETGAKLLEYVKKEMIGKSVFIFIHTSQKEEARKRFQDKLSGKNIGEEREWTYVTKKGEKLDFTVKDILERDKDRKIIGVRRTMLDLTQKKRKEERERKSISRLKNVLEETINALAYTIEMRDPYTAGHQRRVACLASAVGKEMGLSQNRVEGIKMASIVHDIGKIHIPNEILTKPQFLDENEFNMIKSHPRVGYDILKRIDFPWPVTKIILQHHEMVDGSGYPQGLLNDEIMLEARIIAVADVVEAMTSHRPYRSALSLEKALSEISEKKGHLYDTEVVDICINLFREKGFKLK